MTAMKQPKPLTSMEAGARLTAELHRLGANLLRSVRLNGDRQDRLAREADARAVRLRREATTMDPIDDMLEHEAALLIARDLPTSEPMERAMDLIGAFYELDGCQMGGPLHVVTDDDNVEDEFLDWDEDCETWLEEWGPRSGVTDPAAVRAASQAILEALRPLTYHERLRVTTSLAVPQLALGGEGERVAGAVVEGGDELKLPAEPLDVVAEGGHLHVGRPFNLADGGLADGEPFGELGLREGRTAAELEETDLDEDVGAVLGDAVIGAGPVGRGVADGLPRSGGGHGGLPPEARGDLCDPDVGWWLWAGGRVDGAGPRGLVVPLGPKFGQVLGVEPFGDGDGFGVPGLPLAGLVAADQQDRRAAGIEDEQDPKVAALGGADLLEVVDGGAVDLTDRWPAEGRAVLDEEVDGSGQLLALVIVERVEPLGELVGALDVPSHALSIRGTC